MRRPLLGACVVIVILIFFLQEIFSPPGVVPEWLEELSEERVELVGEVIYKEQQIINQHILWRVTLAYPSIGSYSEESSCLVTQANIKTINQQLQNKRIIWETDQKDQLPQIGDWVKLDGTFRLFSVARNPGQFDSYSYYATKKVVGKIANATLLASVEGKGLQENIFSCKQWVSARMQELYPTEEASILMKMLLGDGSLLEKETKQLYKEGGIMHILAISGLHISLLGMGIYHFLRKLSIPATVSGIVGILFLLFYGAMTGWSLSACRAIGMYIVRLLGEMQRENYDMLTAMGILAVILVVLNPGNLYQSGFWLSFGAVMGMGVVSPVLAIKWKAKGRRNHNRILWYRIIEMFCSGWSLALFTIPIQLYFFYEYPVWSIFANLLVLPILSLLVCSTLLSVLFPFLKVCVWLSCLILKWYKIICIVEGNMPFHRWLTGFPGVGKLLLYYGILAVVLWLLYLYRKKMGNQKKLAALVFLSAILVVIFSYPTNRSFSLQMLDVGQGDCILVRTGKGQNYLFDGGSSTYKTVGESIIIPYLNYYGIQRLDGIFVSHGDSDHTSGILELLQDSSEVKINCVYVPDLMDQTEFESIFQAAEQRGIPVVSVSRGDQWTWKDVSLECLYPQKGCRRTDNEASACFLWQVKGRTILLTGDLEGEGETELMEEQAIKDGINILKVAHHGSEYSTSQEFLRVLHPQLALISVGQNNSYGHPHAALLERIEMANAGIVTTGEAGEIKIIIRKGKIYSESYLGKKENGLYITCKKLATD